MSAPTKYSFGRKLRCPRRLTMTNSASSVAASKHHSEAGSACAMLPQKVPRERIGACPMCRATRGKSADSAPPLTGASKRACRASAPTSNLPPSLAHIIERIDPIDVDQAGGAGEPKIHRRHKALSASKDLSFLAVSGKQIERIVDRAGREIFERNGFHQAISGPEHDALFTLTDLSYKSSWKSEATASP